MLLQSCSLSSVLISAAVTHNSKITSAKVRHLFFRRNTKTTIRCFSYTQIAEILQNKVLITAAASAAIGQLLKPFTSLLFCSKSSFDYMAVFRAGGFPSTHSSAVVATATTLGFERGLSDPIFGLAVVYASLIMYDAQGVRREVGSHAKALNRAFSKDKDKLEQRSSITDTNDFADSQSTKPLFLEKLKPTWLRPRNTSLLLKSDDRTDSIAMEKNSVPGLESNSESDSVMHAHFKESVGHSEVEVVAGGLLGFVVSIAICTS